MKYLILLLSSFTAFCGTASVVGTAWTTTNNASVALAALGGVPTAQTNVFVTTNTWFGFTNTATDFQLSHYQLTSGLGALAYDNTVNSNLMSGNWNWSQITGVPAFLTNNSSATFINSTWSNASIANTSTNQYLAVDVHSNIVSTINGNNWTNLTVANLVGTWSQFISAVSGFPAYITGIANVALTNASASFTGTVAATAFSGNGSGLTGLIQRIPFINPNNITPSTTETFFSPSWAQTAPTPGNSGGIATHNMIITNMLLFIGHNNPN